MNILAIETSCDETAICYLSARKNGASVDFSVPANVTRTQVEHAEFGGVFPALAKREHIKNLPVILDRIMDGREKPDCICVTNGPGLEPALWTGIVFAKELGEKWGVPVVPVNHMEGHILSVLVPPLPAGATFSFKDDIRFPALALLISGGHTELVLADSIGDYRIIGKTRDDAVGEAFDKVARLLGLAYPGGPRIAELARRFSGNEPVGLPRPMIHSKDYDFSFSGIKTAVLYMVRERSPLSEDLKAAIAHEFQESAAEVLAKKTARAVEEFGIRTVVIGGGVAANERIVAEITKTVQSAFPETGIMAPTRELSGDNALMIAIAGYFKVQKNPDADYGDIRAEGNLSL